MKTLLTTFVILFSLAFSCENDTKKTETSTTNQNKTKEVETQTKQTSSATVDYSRLYAKVNTNECLDTQTLASIIDIPSSSIIKDDGCKTCCSYEIKIKPDASFFLTFKTEKVGKKSISKQLKKIRGYDDKMKRITNMEVIPASADDNYYFHQYKAGRVVLANPNYDYWLVFTYANAYEVNKKPEEINRRKDISLKIADYLLKKNKN